MHFSLCYIDSFYLIYFSKLWRFMFWHKVQKFVCKSNQHFVYVYGIQWDLDQSINELSDAMKKENTQTISFMIQKGLYKWLCFQLFKYSISKCTSLSLVGNFFGITDSISILFSTSHPLMRWHIIFWEKSAGFSLMFALGGITGVLYRIWIAVFNQLNCLFKTFMASVE